MSLFCKSQKTLFFPWIKFFTKKTKNKNIVWIMIILNYTRSYATIYIFFLLCFALCRDEQDFFVLCDFRFVRKYQATSLRL